MNRQRCMPGRSGIVRAAYGCSSKKKQKEKGKLPANTPARSNTDSASRPRGRQVPPPREHAPPASPGPEQQAEEPLAAAPAPPPMAAPLAAAAPEPPSDELDPHEQALDDRWEQFQELDDYADQIALFQQSLDDGLIDPDNAFDMLVDIFAGSSERNERDHFDALLKKLRERYPDVYETDAGTYIEWQITNALAAGRRQDLPALVLALAEQADEHIEAFDTVLDMLAYHGQTALLVQASELAWPRIKNAPNVSGAEQFADQSVNYVIFDGLERAASPQEMITRATPFIPVDPEQLAHYLSLIKGENTHQWALSDIIFPQQQVRRSDTEDYHSPQLHDLTIEFLGYLHRQEGVPYSRGELARTQIEHYILLRQAGELGPEDESPRRKKLARSGPAENFLCPDQATLDRFLSRLVSFFAMQRYPAVATLELLPAWLRFLQGQQLISEQQHRDTLRELGGLVEDVADIWEEYYSDPALKQGIDRAWALEEM